VGDDRQCPLSEGVARPRGRAGDAQQAFEHLGWHSERFSLQRTSMSQHHSDEKFFGFQIHPFLQNSEIFRQFLNSSSFQVADKDFEASDQRG
jgi:hypothetical protein